MFKFLIFLIIVGQLAAGIAGQQEVRSNGTSGPLCGRGRHCLTNATCNKRRQVCVCQSPLIGNGKLGCFHPNDPASFLQQDPHLKTFFGEYLNLATPCRFKLLEYALRTDDGQTSTVEVYAQNSLQMGGNYNVRQVLVSASVTNNNDVMKHAILIDGEAQNGVYTFKVTVLEDSRFKTAANTAVTNFLVAVSLEEADNFVVATVESAGLTIRFRPAAKDVEFQSMVPGVTMVINGALLDRIQFNSGLLASTPQGPSIAEIAREIGMDKQIYVYFLAIVTYPTPSPDSYMNDRICEDTNIVYNKVCPNDRTKPALLRSCSPLFLDKEFTSCLYKNNVIDQYYTEQKLLFRYCVQAFCTRKADICETMLERLPVQTKCPLPAEFRDFDCAFKIQTLA